MRIAIVSDIHGNITALEAVLADLRLTVPDVILHGGDLADSGSSPAEVVDCIRDLGWSGVAGNTDEMLSRPESLREFAARSSAALSKMFGMIEGIAAAARESLGSERIDWLGHLPDLLTIENVSLVHATPADRWRAPGPEVSTADLRSAFAPLTSPIVAYAHIHQPFIRRRTDQTFINTGSVGLPYDGDPRATYLLLDDDNPTIRRVEYDIERECTALADRHVPHADWIARMLRRGRFCMP